MLHHEIKVMFVQSLVKESAVPFENQAGNVNVGRYCCKGKGKKVELVPFEYLQVAALEEGSELGVLQETFVELFRRPRGAPLRLRVWSAALPCEPGPRSSRLPYAY